MFGKKKVEDPFIEAKRQIMRGETPRFIIKQGHSKEMNKFWVQIVNRERLVSMRIYLSEEEFKMFYTHGDFLHRVETE